MGTKGARSGEAGREAADALVDDLQAVGPITAKRMFGGSGIFGEGVMFALVDSEGRCFLRADDATSQRYESEGGRRHGRMPYWEIPAEVRADQERLEAWAAEALAVARAAKR